MAGKPTYEELAQKVKNLEIEAIERKRAEKALEKNSERLELALLGADLGMWEWNYQTGEGIVDDRWAGMLGYSVEEIGQHLNAWEEDIHPDDLAGMQEALKAHIEGHAPIYESVHRLRNKSGGWTWVLSRGKIIERDSEGNPLRATGTHFDITKRKQAEDALQRAHDELEKSVAERTAELAEANEQLMLEIDERKRTEEMLQIKNTLLSTQQETSLDGILAVDEAGEIISFNQRFVEMWGIPDDVVASRSDERALQSVIDKLVEPEEFLGRVNYLYTHPEEKSHEEIALIGGITFERYSSPMFGQDGKYYGRVWYFRDITERKKVEEALRDSEEKYRMLVDNSSNSIHLYDIEGRLMFINNAGAKHLGGAPQDFIGRTLSHVLPGEADVFMKKHNQTIASGQGTDFEAMMEMPSGKRWFLSNVQPFRDENGDIFAVQYISYDITERKRAEEEVRRLSNLLRNIVDSMPSVLVGVDTEGKVTEWNLEAENATGLTAHEAQGQVLAKVFPQLAGEMEKIRKTITERTPQKDPKVINEIDGETRYSDVTVYPLVANGIEGAVIRVEDVTERVRLEEMMIQSEKMLSVGGLAAGIAHEINNPLAGIIQNVQVIKNRMSDVLPKNRTVAKECGTTMEALEAYVEKRGMSRMLDSVMDSGMQAARIVDNMISFSRRNDARFAQHDLGVLLDKTVELAEKDYDLKRKYDFRRIEIVREYNNTTPKVRCEANKIQQVFLSILRNGAYAMWEDCRTETGTRRIGETGKKDRVTDAGGRSPEILEQEKLRFILRVKPEGSMARVEIEDTGPGMDETIRKRVFEPFFTTKSVDVGTGLGMSVSYFIVTENHGGTIAVESSPGKGTTFIVRLPLVRDGQ